MASDTYTLELRTLCFSLSALQPVRSACLRLGSELLSIAATSRICKAEKHSAAVGRNQNIGTASLLFRC